MRRCLLGGLVALLGCGNSSERQPPADTTSAAPQPADSLVLTMNDGTDVWMVAGRPDTSSAGEVCEERLIELRRGEERIPVPLLYTMTPPRALNDTTLIAPLHRHCAVEAWYVVNTRTGLPTREKGT